MNRFSVSTPPAAASKERSRPSSSRSRSSCSMIVLISVFRGNSTPFLGLLSSTPNARSVFHIGPDFPEKRLKTALAQNGQAVQVSRVVGEDLDAAGGYVNSIRVAKATKSLFVDTRLDREDHPGLERGLIALVEEGRLVVPKADPVARVLAPEVADAVVVEVREHCL